MAERLAAVRGSMVNPDFLQFVLKLLNKQRPTAAASIRATIRDSVLSNAGDTLQSPACPSKGSSQRSAA